MPVIQSGLCYAIFAYDAARSIDLDAAERRILESTQRDTIKHRRRAPSYFEYQPPPLRVTQETEALKIGKFFARPSVDLVVYDFGAVAVIYALPLEGEFANLLDLSAELYDNELLLADSRRRCGNEKWSSSRRDQAVRCGDRAEPVLARCNQQPGSDVHPE